LALLWLEKRPVAQFRRNSGVWRILILFLWVTPAFAVQPNEVLDDPELEQRARDISKELRCLVCQNESIDDSNATLARDLRLLVRERLVAGDSDEATVSYIVDRYGEFVLLRPLIGGKNLILWLAAPVLLVLGLIGTVLMIRSRAQASHVQPQALSKGETARLKDLLDDD